MGLSRMLVTASCAIGIGIAGGTPTRAAPVAAVTLPAQEVGEPGSSVASGAREPREPGSAFVGPEAQDAPEPGAELRVWLITMGPGDAIWERFGHNALRVLDTRTGYDASYNWGIFDFRQEGFVPRFLQGRMLYMMAAFASEPMIEQYRAAGREVIAQELALTPSQKLQLRDFAEWNARPENREYFYHYFLDNCSTRVRDLLDFVLGGAIADRFGAEPTGTSYRDHTRRLTQPDPVLFTGMDILLGSPGDQPITRWAEMFIPMSLRDAVRELEMPDGAGGRRPLVLSEELVAPARVAIEPEAPPGWMPVFLLLGLAIGTGFWVLGRAAATGPRAHAAFGVLAGLWGAATGLGGLVLVLVLLTDHHFMTWNENLFLLNPVSLGLAVVGPWAALRGSGEPRLERAAGMVAALAVLGLVIGAMPFARQENELELALLLPAHVGIWIAARDLRKMRQAQTDPEASRSISPGERLAR